MYKVAKFIFNENNLVTKEIKDLENVTELLKAAYKNNYHVRLDLEETKLISASIKFKNKIGDTVYYQIMSNGETNEK